MNGAVERSGASSIRNGLAEGAGQTAPLSQNGNFRRRPHPINPTTGAKKARMAARAQAWWDENVGKTSETERRRASLRKHG